MKYHVFHILLDGTEREIIAPAPTLDIARSNAKLCFEQDCLKSGTIYAGIRVKDDAGEVKDNRLSFPPASASRDNSPPV